MFWYSLKIYNLILESLPFLIYLIYSVFDWEILCSLSTFSLNIAATLISSYNAITEYSFKEMISLLKLISLWAQLINRLISQS